MTELSNRAPEKPKADLVLSGAKEVLTCVPIGDDPIGRREGVIVALKGEKIIALGSEVEVRDQIDLGTAKPVDVSGKILAPGFVDPHTHLVFGGSRVKENSARMTMDIEEIQALGIPTGIQATMTKTRAASTDELTTLGLDRIGRMLRHGTTTVESKTGYGLSLESELKILEVNRRLQEESVIDVISTFLGAHDFPPEASRNQYVDLIIKEMIPAAAEYGNTAFNDVYCDEGYFTVDQTRWILEAGMDAGLKPKIHVDAYANIGGAEMAAELKVVSADHLNYTSPASMSKLANAGVIGVVMPGLDFAIGHPQPFDARLMIDQGMTLALATDMCPACWIESMQLVMALACRLYRFTPDEALLAATRHAAKALELDRDRGSLEPGKLADIQIWDIPSFEDLIYRIGNNAVAGVVKRGQVVWF
jgi:imidazolonepropionase